MSVTASSAPRRDAGRTIDVRVAVFTWLATFVVGQTVSVAIIATSGVDEIDLVPIPTLFVAFVATSIAYLAGLWAASRQAGSGHPRRDYGLRFRPVDLAGVPIGVLTQLVLVPLVYFPLTRLWPGTFSEDRLSETAEDLADRASGTNAVLLVLMVCLFAPVVEELVYRGLLQGSFSARFDHVVAWLAISLWFALIHFRPVEYPGLFTFGLVTGAALLVTRRLGMSIVTHVAFNLTGLLLAWP